MYAQKTASHDKYVFIYKLDNANKNYYYKSS